MTINVNLSKMFDHYEPWDCSNSAANLGPEVARLTWGCAMHVARDVTEWLLDASEPGVASALDEIREWARDTGGWDREEIGDWTETECFALLVQNLASDLRDLGADDLELADLPAEQERRYETDEDTTRTGLTIVDGAVHGAWYGGI